MDQPASMQPANSAPLKALDLYLRTRLEDIPLDRMTRGQLNRRALKLVRQAIRQMTHDHGWWFQRSFSRLRGDGYSELVVKKAQQYDLNARVANSGVVFVIIFNNAFGHIHAFDKWGWLLIGVWLFILAKICIDYFRTGLSPEDDKLVIEEITGRLGHTAIDGVYPERPLLEKWNRRLEKRALLWRVDRFLSRASK